MRFLTYTLGDDSVPEPPPSPELMQEMGKLVEEAFGWGKTIAGIAKVKVRGLARVRFKFTFAMAAYNPIRTPRPLAAA